MEGTCPPPCLCFRGVSLNSQQSIEAAIGTLPSAVFIADEYLSVIVDQQRPVPQLPGHSASQPSFGCWPHIAIKNCRPNACQVFDKK